ncbi:MAG: arylesterase [Gammaproteobacteria bacterium]|nr:arylesterase [Gammaproteobacteria bacterium]MDH5594112.1 arylesterase [Gammaproteobacteria bacterium]MDH5614655.1 arylesterase [Gammaproteobacteria bacterium]
MKQIILFFLVFVSGCSSSVPQLPPLSPDSVILAFGDSLTYGTGVSEDDAYPAVLEQLTGFSVINAGIPGEETPQGLKRLPQLLEEYKPALLVLCHGGNDILRKRDLKKTVENIKSMINIAKQQGISVVLLGVPEFGLLLSTAEFYPQIAQELNIPFDGETIPDIESDNALKSDAIHPNKAGYRIMAEAVMTLLKQSGAIQ